MNIHIDISELRKLCSSLSDLRFNKALSAGINRSASRIRTIAARNIRAVYNINDRSLKSGGNMPIRKAQPNALHASISLPKHPIPLQDFKKTRATNHGVSIEVIKGQRTIIQGAFLFNSKYNTSPKQSIMHRSYVSGQSSYANTFAFRNQRLTKGKDLPIGAMFSVSPLATVFEPHVSTAILRHGEQIMMQEIERTLIAEINKVLKSTKRRGRRP
jgi:hypothetical protein